MFTCVPQNSGSEKISKIQTKVPLTESFLIKLLTWCVCFSVNFAKFSRWPIQLEKSVDKVQHSGFIQQQVTFMRGILVAKSSKGSSSFNARSIIFSIGIINSSNNFLTNPKLLLITKHHVLSRIDFPC